MTPLTLPCCYLAPVSHYRAALRAGGALLEVCDHYERQTLRNRCWIDSPAGALALTVPVVCPEGKALTREARISDHGNWRHRHWNALVSSYRRSPFFEFYADDFAPFYERKWTFLADFNEDLLRLVCSLLDISPRFERTAAFRGAQPPVPGVGEGRPYYQVFASRHGFLADLSVVDLLFNMGPEAVLLL